MSVTPPPTTVLVADDDERIRLGLVSLLDEEQDFDVVGQAADGTTALTLTVERRPSLALVDMRMPYGGPELVRALRALPHRPAVVGLSARADATAWTAMIAAGACGYLMKGAVAGDLPALLRRCCSGELIVAVPGAVDVVQRLLAGGV